MFLFRAFEGNKSDDGYDSVTTRDSGRKIGTCMLGSFCAAIHCVVCNQWYAALSANTRWARHLPRNAHYGFPRSSSQESKKARKQRQSILRPFLSDKA
eukprot:5416236-Pyramimonas_sp.AAC.1